MTVQIERIFKQTDGIDIDILATSRGLDVHIVLKGIKPIGPA